MDPERIIKSIIQHAVNMKNKNYIPGKDKELFTLTFPEKWTNPIDHIDFIYGVDPTTEEDQTGAVVILRTEKRVKWSKGDILYGPNGMQFKIIHVGFWTWLYRILTISKYYNAKITLVAEK